MTSPPATTTTDFPPAPWSLSECKYWAGGWWFRAVRDAAGRDVAHLWGPGGTDPGRMGEAVKHLPEILAWVRGHADVLPPWLKDLVGGGCEFGPDSLQAAGGGEGGPAAAEAAREEGEAPA